MVHENINDIECIFVVGVHLINKGFLGSPIRGKY